MNESYRTLPLRARGNEKSPRSNEGSGASFPPVLSGCGGSFLSGLLQVARFHVEIPAVLKRDDLRPCGIFGLGGFDGVRAHLGGFLCRLDVVFDFRQPSHEDNAPLIQTLNVGCQGNRLAFPAQYVRCDFGCCRENCGLRDPDLVANLDREEIGRKLASRLDSVCHWILPIVASLGHWASCPVPNCVVAFAVPCGPHNDQTRIFK